MLRRSLGANDEIGRDKKLDAAGAVVGSAWQGMRITLVSRVQQTGARHQAIDTVWIQEYLVHFNSLKEIKA